MTATAKKKAAAAVGPAAEPEGGRHPRRGRPAAESTSNKKARLFRLTVVDAASILAAVALIALSSLSAVAAAGEPQVIISDGGAQEWIYPLNLDRRIEIPGPLGVTAVHIHDGMVGIESSPCPNQTCVAVGSIREPGQWVACLPNQVFVRIEGGAEHGNVVDTSTW